MSTVGPTTARTHRKMPSVTPVPAVDATEALCVGWHTVMPFTVTGTDAHGQFRMVQLFPLTSNSRFRKCMVWAVQAMTRLGFCDGVYDTCARQLTCAPAVREIVAAATSANTHTCRPPHHAFQVP